MYKDYKPEGIKNVDSVL